MLTAVSHRQKHAIIPIIPLVIHKNNSNAMDVLFIANEYLKAVSWVYVTRETKAVLTDDAQSDVDPPLCAGS